MDGLVPVKLSHEASGGAWPKSVNRDQVRTVSSNLRVVVNLVNRIAVEGVGADLELDHKERAMAQQQRICAFAHAGNGEFQEEMPGIILDQRVLKNRDFSEPRVSLLVLKGMMMGPGELAKDCVIRYSEKSDDRGVKVCVSHGAEFQ